MGRKQRQSRHQWRHSLPSKINKQKKSKRWVLTDVTHIVSFLFLLVNHYVSYLINTSHVTLHTSYIIKFYSPSPLFICYLYPINYFNLLEYCRFEWMKGCNQIFASVWNFRSLGIFPNDDTVQFYTNITDACIISRWTKLLQTKKALHFFQNRIVISDVELIFQEKYQIRLMLGR